jgi:DHA1 family bicyclomycin/chloramphenicol resistance-like MFS transporter
MQPFGTIAGSASSFQNFARTVLAASIGVLISQQFDGSVTPIAIGFVLCGIAALTLVLIGEHGRLFARPRTTRHLPLP